MKKLSIAAFITFIFIGHAMGQQRFSTEYFTKNLGKTNTLCDTIYSLRIISDTLTYLHMGGAYPNQKYIVAIKGNKINLNWTNLKGKPLCVTGVFELIKGNPEIEIAEPDRINMK